MNFLSHQKELLVVLGIQEYSYDINIPEYTNFWKVVVDTFYNTVLLY